MANTVKIKKYSDIIEEYPMLTGQAVVPGMLIELDADLKVKKHDSAGGELLPMFALEDELQGKNIDDAYGDDQPVQCWIPGRGDIVYAMLADGEDITCGDFLGSAGNGYLKDYSTGTIVGQAIESIDLGDSEGDWPATGRRIKVRII